MKKEKIKWKLNGVLQHDEADCGIASLSTICKYYGLKIPLVKLREMEGNNINGTSLYSLKEIAEKLGFNASVLKGDFKELEEGLKNKEINLPIVFHAILENGFYHFGVVWKLGKNHVYIFDPSIGNRKLKKSEFMKIWTGYILEIEKTEEFLQDDLKKGYYRKYMLIVSKEKSMFGMVLLLSTVISGITIGGTFLYQQIVDHFLIHADKHVLEEGILIFVLLMVAYIFRMIIYIMRGLVSAKLSKRVEKIVMDNYFNKTIKQKICFFESYKVGEILARYYDIRKIRELLTTVPVNIVLDVVMALMASLAIFAINKNISICIVCLGIFYLLVVWAFKDTLHNNNRIIAQNEAEVVSDMKEIIEGIEVIKAFGKEEVFINKISDKGNVLLNNIEKGNKVFSLNLGITSFIEASAQILTFAAGSMLVLKNIMSLGNLITVLLLVEYIFTPLRYCIEMQNQILTAIVSIERVNDILERKEENLEVSKSRHDFGKDIHISNLSFGYSENNLIFNNASVVIYHGKSNAFIGESGSGKTTLAKILLRYYTELSGEIILGDKKFDKMTCREIRDNIAYVSQNTKIFSDTLLNNITLYSEYSEWEIRNVISMCGLDHLMENTNLGIHSMLGENGNNLSVGEKQRIGLARALIKKPSVLILDEITSNLDPKSRGIIYNTVFEKYKGNTILIITHDINMIEKCDYVNQIKNGKIVNEISDLY